MGNRRYGESDREADSVGATTRASKSQLLGRVGGPARQGTLLAATGVNCGANSRADGRYGEQACDYGPPEANVGVAAVPP